MRICMGSTKTGVVTSEMFFSEDGYSATPLPKADSKELAQKLTDIHRIKIGLLPPAVRWVSDSKRMVVFERPPCEQTIDYYMSPKDEVAYAIQHNLGHRTYTVPFPWTVYIAYFDTDFNPVEVRAYVRPGPLESMDDPLFAMPLLNFYNTSKLCNPVFGKFEQMEPTLANGVNAAYNMVWNSGFNYDLSDSLKNVVHSGVFPRSRLGKAPLAPEGTGQNLDEYSWFYHRWSEKTMGDALLTSWPTPAKDGRSSDPLTVAGAINYINVSVQGAGDNTENSLAKEFIVHIANALNG